MSVTELANIPAWPFALVAALIAILGAFAVQRFVAYRNASVKFRAAVIAELKSIYPLPVSWPQNIDGFLRLAFPALQSAVAEFRPFVPSWRRRAFDQAWSQYRNAYGREVDAQVYHHYIAFDDQPNPGKCRAGGSGDSGVVEMQFHALAQGAFVA